MMRKTIFSFLTLSITLLVTGCEPLVFGVSQDQWQHLTPQQQTQVIQGYNERQRIEAINAPVVDAINAAAFTINNAIRSNRAYNGDGDFLSRNYSNTPYPFYPGRHLHYNAIRSHRAYNSDGVFLPRHYSSPPYPFHPAHHPH